MSALTNHTRLPASACQIFAYQTARRRFLEARFTLTLLEKNHDRARFALESAELVVGLTRSGYRLNLSESQAGYPVHPRGYWLLLQGPATGAGKPLFDETSIDCVVGKAGFNGRVTAARARFTQIGQGSSRTVFALPGKVLKVAHNFRGKAQNRAERNPAFSGDYKTLLCPVVASDPGGNWLVQERAEPFAAARPVGEDRTVCYNRYCDEISLFARRHGMPAEDLYRTDNLGWYQNRLVSVDYGLTHQGYEKYYACTDY